LATTHEAKATSSQSSTLDRVSNKLATNCTPASAKQTVGGNSAPNSFSVDNYYPPGNNGSNSNSSAANTAASDDVHSCSDSPPTISLTATDNHDGKATLTAFVSAGTHPLNDSKYAQFPGTVTFNVNGQDVGTKQVNDPQDTVSISYNVPSSGSFTITATVTDSVLYSASDTTTENFSGGTAGSPITITGAVAVGATTTINWSGGTGTVTVSNGAITVCTAPASSGGCSGPGAPKNSTVTAKDSSGGPPDSKKVN
jgi:hypothetical protein